MYHQVGAKADFNKNLTKLVSNLSKFVETEWAVNKQGPFCAWTNGIA